MVSLQSLYTQAEKQNIPILFYPMPGCGSMSVQLPGGSCAIGMDVAPQAEAVEREHLGHELGHCMTGSFYNIYAVADLRERQENRADKWAIRRLIPVEALDDAIAAGHTELWDLAEFFGVTESFLKKAAPERHEVPLAPSLRELLSEREAEGVYPVGCCKTDGFPRTL